MKKSVKWSALAVLFFSSTAFSQSVSVNTVPVPGANQTNAGSVMEFVLNEMQEGTLVEADAESATRIYGGRPAEPGAWPAQVGLHAARHVNEKPESLYQSHFCGGSIIARQWILTAAHCVVDGQGKAISPDDVLIRSGATRIVEGDLRKVVRVIPHEEYDPLLTNHDIALLQLAEPIRNSSGPVGAIAVAPQGQEPPQGPSVVIGWGKDDNNRIAVDLLETDIDIVSNATCNEGMKNHMMRGLAGDLISFGRRTLVPEPKLDEAFTIIVNSMGDMITTNMMCAGVPSGKKTSCQGDSGGPLMVRQENGKWLQVGIVSWGATSVNNAGEVVCGIEQTYAIYTRLSNYFNWISSHVRGG
ncbi:MAG: serine protease [Pseudomonadota bacterium]